MERYEYKGLTIVVDLDKGGYDCNPRENNNTSKMVCWHGRYNLGDEQPSYQPQEFFPRLAFEIDPDFQYGELTKEVIEQAREIVERNAVILPLYLYDHSGITISTSPFSCKWDSGQVGWVYITLDMAKKNWLLSNRATWNTKISYPDEKKIKLREAASRLLESEVEEYDAYLRGEVYSYTVLQVKTCNLGHKHEDVVASCTGFVGGPEEYVRQEAEAAADAFRSNGDEA